MLRREVVRVCHEIDRRAYVGGRDGNVSVRLDGGAILVTRAGVRKGDVTEHDLIRVDSSGARVGGDGHPSTETGMHLRIYELRPDVGAVVHAHPPVATGFAAAGQAMDECVLPEVVVGLGAVPLARYATPGTPELSSSLDPLLAAHDAILLENHGVVTLGPDVDSAYQRMENVEHAARILLVARLLGGPSTLTPGQVGDLVASRARYGVRPGLASCRTDAAADAAADEALVEEVVERLLARLHGQDRRPGG